MYLIHHDLIDVIGVTLSRCSFPPIIVSWAQIIYLDITAHHRPVCSQDQRDPCDIKPVESQWLERLWLF
ncbi:hypothetical protein CY34DRAFT_804038 [Suillus luteus UH-Slu-Lm8-n1]|uniref:Unplaced genomic scaffold CY34scaffold_86, whole genome shotgun sequence n=1 Tax=Suillus luteus UH-Slu-Lm8-n1 TaxID=930992 RepID=A0A0D0BJ42_9AGAM|nr:hypothetical protein CY34DRAFT_804038 [Suillus luteus UH-Slu-Lm8-n1]